MLTFKKALIRSKTATSFLVQALVLDLFPFVRCSSSQGKNKQENSSKWMQQVDSKKAFDIAVHGIVLWASMGCLMPFGVLVIRISTTEKRFREKFKVFYYIHAVLQVLAVLVATGGAVLSIRNFENAFDNTHQRIGLALYAAIYVQVLIGLRRPKRGTKIRRVWYFMHWLLGITIPLVGIFNTYTGLNAYHLRTSKSTSLWTILFTAQVSFMAVLYLFQDKWEYIQKQGVNVPNDDEPINCPVQVIPNSDTQLETESARKSNALGTYFSRSNALKKLFQLT
ncbi:hypothetical protein LIER_11138 [Lithospermum erythrorhizon]|uniref:Cytochrome b561 domain-containing protein n=1 Tax=Lithospermum erythrorhizon TaxID=34254 RepID=A0AAV3PNG8_LITER